MAQLAERLLSMPEVCGSNPVTTLHYTIICFINRLLKIAKNLFQNFVLYTNSARGELCCSKVIDTFWSEKDCWPNQYSRHAKKKKEEEKFIETFRRRKKDFGSVDNGDLSTTFSISLLMDQPRPLLHIFVLLMEKRQFDRGSCHGSS